MNFLKGLTIILVVFTVFSGCKKHDDHDDHIDIGGLQLIMNNNVIVTQSGTTVNGSIDLESAEISSPITVVFRDPEGHDINIADEDYTLSVDVIQTTNNLTAQVGTGAARWTFTLSASGTGGSQIRVNLLHGGHKDFESRDITVAIVSIVE